MTTQMPEKIRSEAPQSSNLQSNKDQMQSKVDWLDAVQAPRPRDPFLVGLAELMGQFEPEALDPHRAGLLALVNGAAAGHLTALRFEDDTPMVVIQRAVGHLAGRA